MKKKKQFAVLADFYDRLNGADYNMYADYIENVFKVHGNGRESLLLDLACGTGKLTEELALRGYDMIGADISEEMLTVAVSRAYQKNLSILYLKQDMRNFELYGTVDCIICSLDGVSYITETNDVKKCFKLIYNYLNPGALFIFDINSAYRFKEIFAKRDFFLADDGVYLGWKNEFDPKKGFCDFILTVFTEDPDGSYEKKEEVQREKMWEKDELCILLQDCGLEVVNVYGDLNMRKVIPTDEKWYFVCRRMI